MEEIINIDDLIRVLKNLSDIVTNLQATIETLSKRIKKLEDKENGRIHTFGRGN